MVRIVNFCVTSALGCALTLAMPPFSACSKGNETVLYSFQGGSGGSDPRAALIEDKSGNLFGASYAGGGAGCDQEIGCGTVFELPASGSETVLHAFTGQPDGAEPWSTLIEDSVGDLYGTTSAGGADDGGSVFEIAADGTQSTLYSFTGGNDGATPLAGLIIDVSGNLYGTTESGGASGDGTVFELAPDGTETVLYSFSGKPDGRTPEASLIADSSGNLYGTTEDGGRYDNGTVFEIAADGTESVLYSFAGGKDGAYPYAGLVADTSGNLYGTTQAGGGGSGCTNGCGTIFEIKQ